MIGGAWEASLRAEIERSLTQKTLLFAHRVETDHSHSLAEIAAQEGQAAGARATIIDASGKVLADSETNPTGMESDGTRPEFVAALSDKTGESERRSATLGVPFLYVAVPISGGAVRLAYPLSDVEAVQAQVHQRLLWGSAIALFIALVIAASASVWTSRRLERIVDVAARIEQGDLHARVEDSPLDEIGRVPAAIDKTAGQVERSFAAVRSSQRQLETLLNSMQDAVIAVSADGLVQWANQPMDPLAPPPRKSRHCYTPGDHHGSHVRRLRPRLRRHRRASARWRRRRRAPRPHRNRARRKNPPRFHPQRFPRTPYSAHFDSGLLRNPARPQLRSQ